MSFMFMPAASHSMKLYVLLSIPKSICSMGSSDRKENTLSIAESRLNTNEPKR